MMRDGHPMSATRGAWLTQLAVIDNSDSKAKPRARKAKLCAANTVAVASLRHNNTHIVSPAASAEPIGHQPGAQRTRGAPTPRGKT